jgi:hypothetical protein
MSARKYVRTEETRRKMSETHKGHAPTFTGPHTTRSKELISKANAGKVRSPETRAKIREAMLKRFPPKPKEKETEGERVCDICGKECRNALGLTKHKYYMHTPEGRAAITAPRPAQSVVLRCTLGGDNTHA